MRKLDIYAQEKFGGDLHAALTHLYTGTAGDKLDDYVDELTSEEAAFVFGIIRQDAIEHYGSKKAYQAAFRRARLLASIHMTEEEVRSAESSPFKKDMLRNLLLLAAVLPVDGVLSAFGFPAQIPLVLSGVAIALLSNRLVGSIRAHSRFRKLKKELGQSEAL